MTGWDSKPPPDDGDDDDGWTACVDPSSVPAKALLKVCTVFGPLGVLILRLGLACASAPCSSFCHKGTTIFRY
jgi:hypothetical protein